MGSVQNTPNPRVLPQDAVFRCVKLVHKIDSFLESYADRLSLCLTERFFSSCLRYELLGDMLEEGGLALSLTSEDVEETPIPISRWWHGPQLRPIQLRNARRVSLRTLSENQRLGTLCVQRVRKLCIVLDNLHKPPSFVEQLVGAFDELKVVFATRELDEYADPMPIVHVVGMGHPRADNMGFKLWRRQGSIPKPSINGYEIDEGHLITGQIDVEPLMLPTALQHVPWTTYQVTIASERKGRPQWASRIQGIDTNCHWNNVKRK